MVHPQLDLSISDRRRTYIEDGQKRKEESRYIRLVKTIFKVGKRQCVPLYSSKYSRKDFTLWQHIALIALMQRVSVFGEGSG